MTRDRASVLSAAAALAATACLLAGLAQFRGPAVAHALGWRLYWMALVLAVVAAWPWRGRPPVGPPATRAEVALLALVLLAGAAFRAYRLDTAPYGVWFDEAQNGLEAMRILAEPAYRPVFVPGISQLPALVFYYFALFVDLLGPRVLALRVATTVVGLLAIVAVWALGRELFGRRVGLIAAGLLAVSRWHVTFSRFAVSNLAVTLFLPLALLLFVRCLRRRSARDAVLCGVALGLGLQSYYAMLAAPVVLAALFGLDWARGPARGLMPAGLFALVLATGAFTYAPVLQYARTHPQEYGQRMRATTFVRADSTLAAVSLLVRPSPRLGEAWAALGANAKAHALMFHVRGDSNGRHNLPGAPMLDPLAGTLFAIGLLWCLARPVDPRRAALLLSFGAMMAAGVLSLTFEAPQGARTLGATPFVALMGAVPLAWLARSVGSRAGARTGIAAAGIVLALAGAWSWRVFDRQLWDASAWESWSTPETRIAEVVRDHGRDAAVYVPETLLGGPTLTFLLGEPLGASSFERGRDLPLPSRQRAALLFFPGSEEETAALVRELYPRATVEPFGAPRPDGGVGNPVLWIARVPAESIASIQGWEVSIERAGGSPRSAVTLASEWDWDHADPPFTARVRGTLRVTDDVPRVFARGGAPATVTIDGEDVVHASEARSEALRLARGMHAVELAVPVTRRGQRTALLWGGADDTPAPVPLDQMFSPGLPVGGLLGAYHAGLDLAGEPGLLRIDPQVAFYFHLLPLPRPFSVRWTGSVFAPSAGRYVFGISSVDESSVQLDGHTVLANGRPGVYAENAIDLDAGWHAIEVRYRARSDYSQVVLQWVPPEGPRERVPAAMLRPPGPSGRLLPRDAPAPTRPAPRAAPIPPPAPVSGSGAALAVIASRQAPSGDGLRLAAASDGRVFVLSPSAKRVWLVGAKGAPVPVADAPGGYVDPADLAMAPDGRLHVLDAGGFIAVFSGGLRPERRLDLRPLGVYNPRGLAVTASEILVADTGGGRVLVLDREGRLQRAVGRPGQGPGELSDPADAARDADGGLVVVDAGNGRVQRFARDGHIETWPRPGDRPGLLAERLDVDTDGAVWVGGGGAREVWKLVPGLPPRRHALADSLQPDGLAVGDRRLFLGASARVVEVRVP